MKFLTEQICGICNKCNSLLIDIGSEIVCEKCDSEKVKVVTPKYLLLKDFNLRSENK